MTKHKWTKTEGMEWYRCTRCDCRKYPVRKIWGGWAYVLQNGGKVFARPECRPANLPNLNLPTLNGEKCN